MEQSVEDRVGGMIVGEDPEEGSEDELEEVVEPVSEEAPEEEDEGSEEESDPIDEIQFEEVEYDGITYQVPNTLKDALMRQTDYTQKTQSLADQRREVELQKMQVEVTQSEQRFIGDIQPDLNNIGYLQAHIQKLENELHTNLSSMTSEQMFKKKIEVDGYKEQFAALKDGLQVKYREFEEAQKQSYEELLNQGAQILKKAIPDWSEDKQVHVRDFALSKGFSQQEVNSIIDPRHVQILWAASQYEALKGKATPAADKVKSAPAIQAKARNPMSAATRGKLDLRNKLKSNKLSAKEKEKLMIQDFGERFG